MLGCLQSWCHSREGTRDRPSFTSHVFSWCMRVWYSSAIRKVHSLELSWTPHGTMRTQYATQCSGRVARSTTPHASLQLLSNADKVSQCQSTGFIFPTTGPPTVARSTLASEIEMCAFRERPRSGAPSKGSGSLTCAGDRGRRNNFSDRTLALNRLAQVQVQQSSK